MLISTHDATGCLTTSLCNSLKQLVPFGEYHIALEGIVVREPRFVSEVNYKFSYGRIIENLNNCSLVRGSVSFSSVLSTAWLSGRSNNNPVAIVFF